jgi:hypothetical protein
MGTFTVTGMFGTADDVLAAAERVREQVGDEASVQLFLPGKADQAIEASVEADSSDWRRIAVFGFGLGLVAAYVFQTIGASWQMGLVGLTTGTLAGVLLGAWLSGESFPSRIARREMRGRVGRALRGGHPAILVAVADRHAAERVRDLLEAAEGYLDEAEHPRAPIEQVG